MFGGIKTLTLFFFFGRDRRRVFGGIGGGLERVSRETRRENKSLHLLKGKNGRRRGGSRRQTPLAHQNPFKLGRLEEGEMASWETCVNFQFPPHFKTGKIVSFICSFLSIFFPSFQTTRVGGGLLSLLFFIFTTLHLSYQTWCKDKYVEDCDDHISNNVCCLNRSVCGFLHTVNHLHY